MDTLDDISSAALDARPALKAEVLRLLLEDGQWRRAAKVYQRETGATLQEAADVINTTLA